MTPDDCVYEALDASHDISGFTCGEESLDAYLRDQALREKARCVSSPFVVRLPDSPYVIGYYTLSNYAVVRTDLPRPLQRKVGPYRAVPATLLGRLAVRQEYGGQGFGEALLVSALRRCLTSQTASAMVVVHALHEKAAAFYTHLGFLTFPEDDLQLYILMQSVRDSMPPPVLGTN